ncbi:tyrosine-type recombinase/integrase [Mycolicibacterium tusciae]|uniref:tyrosine-type recombinase/integrase n=1 Tax=Mycolicibacterium tusciae TaxID=75922 RepID=UPI00024A2F0A|nr:tyrosine-type recombinase/integrase [Mycolicibacterium tusciae]
MGQALGLRHGDLDPMRRRVQICRREDNENGALSKQRAQFTVDAPRRFFDLYATYLLGEIAEVDSDYVFVNLSRPPVGGPLSYSNAYQLVERVGTSAGIDELHPHTLRHTHATALARAGWTAAEIAARLGHSHASSADVYIHLASDDLAERLRRTNTSYGGHRRTGQAMARGESRSESARAKSRPTLRVPDGPWCQPTWQVVEVAGDRRRQAVEPCAVDGCDGQRYWLGGPSGDSTVDRLWG